MLRLINALVIGALIVAATYVYKIKFESTRQAEQVAKLRTEIRKDRDTIAILRADWARLDRPDRIENLAKRHLNLKPVLVTQFDHLDNLPERPVPLVPPGTADPIGAVIESFADSEVVNGTLPEQGTHR